MKNLFYFLSLLLVFVACDKQEETKLELFSPEAFCYSLDSGWELNGTVYAKGFLQQEKENKYYSKISYSVDIFEPGNNIKPGIFKNSIEKNESEKISDIALECQIELDSTYDKGDYTLIFNVTDELSKQTKQINKTFKVE